MVAWADGRDGDDAAGLIFYLDMSSSLNGPTGSKFLNLSTQHLDLLLTITAHR